MEQDPYCVFSSDMVETYENLCLPCGVLIFHEAYELSAAVGNDGLRTILFSLPRKFSKGNADILSRQPNLLASSAKWTKP